MVHNLSLCLRDARRDQPALRLAAERLNVPFCGQKPEDAALRWYDNLYENLTIAAQVGNWINLAAKIYPGSAVNTECKWLLLKYAFEQLNCICVEFRTHAMNLQSRRAIERLGAKQDGILRNNMIMANGSYRDSAVYSIIATEWPSVKANLTWQLQQRE